MLSQIRNKLNFALLNRVIKCYVCRGTNITCNKIERTIAADGLPAIDVNYKTATYRCHSCNRDHIQGFYAMSPMEWLKETVKYNLSRVCR